jgi:hypothetical protein|nr:MAG TPA: hypothetical protein [Caudoviricetes sp.]
MKQDGYKNIFRAEDFEQFVDELDTMDRIAKLMGDIDTMSKNYRVQKKTINVTPLYDLPVFYPCNDGKYRYPCSDGKWRTYDEIVDEAAHAQHQGTLALPQQAQQHAPRGIVANIRAAVAKALGNGQRKREKGERE